MSHFPRSPKLLKGAIVLLDSVSFFPKGMITLQYNPETLRRTMQVRGAGSEGGDRLDNITANYLGDPEQFWLLCDANNAMHPDELTAQIGQKLRIPLI